MLLELSRNSLSVVLVLWSLGLSVSEPVPTDNVDGGPGFDAAFNTDESKASIQQQPHLILIVADDLGWNDVSWNNPAVHTPNLGQLAAEGVMLNRSYVQPICTPTRTALLASRYPFTLGRQNNVIFPLTPTGLSLNVSLLPQELKKLGYDTHAVGKWHLGFCKEEYTPTSRGFDSFFGYYTGAEDYYSHVIEEYYKDGVVKDQSTLECKDNEGIGHFATGYDFRNNRTVDREVVGNYSAFSFADRVSAILSSRRPEEPLFLYLPFQSVHAPLQVPQEYRDLYSYIKDINRRTYLGMVTAMDDAVGKVVASLKATGHYDNSVIVFTTDNGGPTMSGGNNFPLRGNKTTLWEGGTRGAAFVHSPMLSSPGTVSNRMIHVTDWCPTFLRLAGAAPPPGMDGVNQWEVLKNSSLPDARDYFVYDIDNTDGLRAAVRWNRYKLIVGDPGPGEWIPPPQVEVANNTNEISAFVKYDEIEISGETNFEDFRETAFEDFRETLPMEKVTDTDTDMNLNTIEHNRVLEKIVKEVEQSDPSDHLFYQEAVRYLSKIENDVGRVLSINGEEIRVHTSGMDSSHGEETYDTARKQRIGSHREILLQRKRQHLKETRRLKTVLSSTQNIEDFDSASHLLNSKLKIQLYDVMADPSERNDLSQTHRPIVKLLLTRLHEEFPRYVARDLPPSDARGDPSNFNSTWSPGWC